jgi:hypothetical protein
MMTMLMTRTRLVDGPRARTPWPLTTRRSCQQRRLPVDGHSCPPLCASGALPHGYIHRGAAVGRGGRAAGIMNDLPLAAL